jgi:hypothetical protein
MSGSVGDDLMNRINKNPIRLHVSPETGEITQKHRDYPNESRSESGGFGAAWGGGFGGTANQKREPYVPLRFLWTNGTPAILTPKPAPQPDLRAAFTPSPNNRPMTQQELFTLDN